MVLVLNPADEYSPEDLAGIGILRLERHLKVVIMFLTMQKAI